MNEQIKETIETIPAGPVWEPEVNSFQNEAEPYPENTCDRRLAWLMFILAFMAADVFGIFQPLELYGLGVTIFALVYILVILVYAGMKKYRIRFGELLYRYSRNIGSDICSRIWTLVCSLPLGCYLFGLIYGTANKRGTGRMDRETIQNGCKALAVVPAVSIYTALTGVCLLYILFIYLQGNYFIGAIRGVLPAGFTYSEYARRGFFELLELCLLNAAILAGAELFCRKKDRIIKGYRILVSALTLFLIGTAMTKMLLYIEAYGLTPLRVIPSVFMIYLAFVFLLLIISQFKELPYVKIGVCAFALGFSLLAVSDMDGRIAGYNLNRYQAGTLNDFPHQTLIECGPAAIPAIYRAWSSEQDPERREVLRETALQIRSNDYWLRQPAGWKNINLVKSDANAGYEKMDELFPDTIIP